MRTLLFAAVMSVAALAGCSKDKADSHGSAAAKDEFPSLTLDEVERDLAAKQIVAVDCNGDRTRKKLGVLPGAILISDEELYQASELPADTAAKLVFYCSDPG